MATASVWQRPPDAHADVAVVGGGVIGAATAFWLGRLAPDLRVVLLEARRLAYGASGRNAGFLLLGTASDYASAVDAHGRDHARRIWRFTSESLRHVVEDVDDGTLGLERRGSVIAAGSESEADRLRRSRTLLAEDGVESRWLSADGAEREAGVRAMHGALVVPEGGAVDPLRLVRRLAASSGADVWEGAAVSGLEAEGGRVRLDLGPGTLWADRVVLAVGPRLPELVPSLRAAVRPVRAQMLATAPMPRRLLRPVYSHEGYFYLRQRSDGRVLLGGARHLHRDAEVGHEDAVTDALQADLERYLHRHLEGTEPLAVERRWSGTMGFSDDGLPRLGAVPGLGGALYATGFTGHGMGYGVRFGRLVANRLLERPDEALDLFRDAPRPNLSAARDVL